jgi:hypothetical protein
MIRYVYPGSWNWTFLILDPGSRGQKGTGSRIRIRNTAGMLPHQIIVDRDLCIQYMYCNHTCPSSQVKKTKVRPDYSSAPTQLALCLRLATT